MSIPLRPSIKPNNKSLGSLLVCLRTSNPGDCAKLALSNLIVDCGETTIDGSEFKIEDIDIDTVIKDSEVVMKSYLPKIFRDAVPGIDAFSNAVERIVDVCMMYLCISHYVPSDNNGIIPLGTPLS